MTCSILDCPKPRHCRGYCDAHYARFLRHGDPLGGRTPPGKPLRYIQEVALLHTSSECLTWPFGKDGDGYGQLRVDGKKAKASRYICQLAHGAPPSPRHEAAHSCGKGHEACIAPGHLSWKTPTENQADKVLHGTINRGERNANAKITQAAAGEILALKGIEKRREIANRFGVSYQTVGRIHNGRSWAWLSITNPHVSSSQGS